MSNMVSAMVLVIFAISLHELSCRRTSPLRHLSRHRSTAFDTSYLRLIATSYNAGNTKFKNEVQARGLAETLALGHETADIMVMGFQEYNDKFAARKEKEMSPREPAAGIAKVGEKAMEWRRSRDQKSPQPQRFMLSDFIQHHLWANATLPEGTDLANFHFESTLFSGKACHNHPRDPHYDTSLHVFVNPESSWDVEDVFNYDMSESGLIECGKGFNFIRLVMQQRVNGQQVAICLLNTHLSFSGVPTDRLRTIRKAMDFAHQSNCDSIVFAGDFNTRLQCIPRDFDLTDKIPPLVDDETTHFWYVARAMREKFQGRLAHRQFFDFDELDLALKHSEFRCKQGREWKVVDTKHSIEGLALREAADIKFPPTYKFSSKVKVQELLDSPEDAGFLECFDGEDVCLHNEKMDWKHNPAWTDRILIGDRTDEVTITTQSYDRRVLDAGSDHAMVFAGILLEVNTASLLLPASPISRATLSNRSGPSIPAPNEDA